MIPHMNYAGNPPLITAAATHGIQHFDQKAIFIILFYSDGETPLCRKRFAPCSERIGPNPARYGSLDNPLIVLVIVGEMR